MFNQRKWKKTKCTSHLDIYIYIWFRNRFILWFFRQPVERLVSINRYVFSVLYLKSCTSYWQNKNNIRGCVWIVKKYMNQLLGINNIINNACILSTWRWKDKCYLESNILCNICKYNKLFKKMKVNIKV